MTPTTAITPAVKTLRASGTLVSVPRQRKRPQSSEALLFIFVGGVLAMVPP